MPQIIGEKAGNVLGVQRIFCPNFPKFSRKTLQQTFSLQIFCNCRYIIFSSTT